MNLTLHSALVITQEEIRVQTWFNSTLLYHSTFLGCFKLCVLPAALKGILPAYGNHLVAKPCPFSSSMFDVLTARWKTTWSR